MTKDITPQVENELLTLVRAVGSDKVQALLDKITGNRTTVGHEITVSDALVDLVRGTAGRVNEFMTRAEKLQQGKYKGIPAEFLPVLRPEEIEATINQLDAAVQAVVEKGEAKEAAYQEKPQLLKRRTQLETDVKITEAGAIMDIRGSGRDQYAVVAGEKVPLSNDQARDAYRRMASKEQREALALVNADINATDVDIQKATDAWYTAKEAADSIRAKANLQAALLTFLANRG